MAGAELFTGNNFVMAAAALRKTVSWGDAAKLWAVCWTGNLIGSLLSVAVFQLTGLPSGDTAAYFGQVAAAKVGLDPLRRHFGDGITCSLAGKSSALQHSRMPGCMVRHQDEDRIRKADHDFLVHFCVHGIRI